MGPNSDGHLENHSDHDGWVNGTLDITADKSLKDVIQDVIRSELFWNYLSGLETWKRLELTDLALAEAAQIIGASRYRAPMTGLGTS